MYTGERKKYIQTKTFNSQMTTFKLLREIESKKDK